MPKATLSRRLSALEEALNVRLVRRSKKGVVLTEQGQQLYDRTRDVFLLAEEAVAAVQDVRVALSGTIRLSLPPDMAHAVLAPALIKFKRGFPNVTIDMTLADRRIFPSSRRAMTSSSVWAPLRTSLAFRKIATLPRTLVASPDFLRTHSSLKQPDDLSKIPALAIRRDQIEWDLQNADAETRAVSPKIGFAANRQATISLVDAALAGLGVANLPTFMIESELESGALVRVLPTGSRHLLR